MRIYIILLAVSFIFFTVIGLMTGTVNSVESFFNVLPVIGPIIEGKGIIENIYEGVLVFAITALFTNFHSSNTSFGRFIERFITACISSIIVRSIRIYAGIKFVQVLAACVFIGIMIWYQIDREKASEYLRSFFIAIISYGIVLVIISEIRQK